MVAPASALLLLTVATLCRGVPVVEETSRWRRDVTPSYNDSELECFKQNKVLYADGKCYSLRARGPCARGSWLVLSKNRTTLPDGSTRSFRECQQIRCTQSHTVYWPEVDGCKHVRKDLNSTCPYSGNRFGINEYGDGECMCKPSYARHEQDIVKGRGTDAEWVGNCYPLYRQGPCEEDQIFQTALFDDYLTVGVCVANPCRSSSTNDPGSAFARLAPESPCYKLGQLGGPCSTNETFDIHPLILEPRCFKRGQTTSTLDSIKSDETRCGGNIDPNTKECRNKFIPKGSKKYNHLDGSKKPRPRLSKG